MEERASMSLPPAKAKLLDGYRGLVVRIANDQSMAWGCARAFRALGVELAVMSRWIVAVDTFAVFANPVIGSSPTIG